MTRLALRRGSSGRPHPEGPVQEGRCLRPGGSGVGWGRHAAGAPPETTPEPRSPGSYRPTVEPLLSDASAQSACAATAVCVKAGARRDGGGEEGGGGGGGRGGGGHEAGSPLAEETRVAAAASRSLRNIVGVSRRDRSWEVGPGRTCCAGPGRGDARPLHPPAPRARALAPRPSAAGSGGRGRGPTRVSSGAWGDEGRVTGAPGGGRRQFALTAEEFQAGEARVRPLRRRPP